MKFILTLFVACISIAANAQKWAPLGATWTYTLNDQTDMFYKSNPKKWTVTDTITQNGHLCSIMTAEMKTFPENEIFDKMITYEDGDKVYWYIPELNDFTVLYDFTKLPGESWTINGMKKGGETTGTVCPFVVKVVSVGVDTINGIPLKTMILKDSAGFGNTFAGKVIQHIGHLTRPRPAPARLCNSISDIYDYFGLRCIDNSYLGFYDFKIVPTCDYVLNINEEILQAGLTIYPNPSNGCLTITAPHAVIPTKEGSLHAKVYDLLGRIIYQSKVSFSNQQASIQLNAPNGIYILELTDAENQSSRQRIEIRN